jgi:hypothetical protein
MAVPMKLQNQFLALCGFSLLQSQVLSAYDLHEWGTFTTVSGSDGGLLAGLHVEEEHLPAFVYSHLGMNSGQFSNFSWPGFPQINSPARVNKQIPVALDDQKVLQSSSMLMSKGMLMAQLENVTVKMETPVIFFYGDDTPKVNVKVGFNGGTISQWYPDRKSGDTPNKILKENHKISDQLKNMVGDKEMILIQNPINFGDSSKPYQGAIEWDVEILPKSAADSVITYKPEENPTWIYPRVPAANVVKVGSEYENFLFYRGVGNFELPATFSVDSSETVSVSNKSKEAIPFAFAFENISGEFRYKTIGKIPAGEVAKVAESEWIKPSTSGAQQVEVFLQMREGLMAQGLSSDEANGMIKTWWKSYFRKPGLRVFWIVPQTDLERILPLKADPAPANQVRVLVGRADIMRPKFEQQMIADLGTKAFSIYQQDRFLTPYTNRLRQLVKEPVFQKFDTENLTDMQLVIEAKKDKSSQGEGFYLSANSDVKLQHLKLSGAWKIIGENQLKIGEAVFLLDPKTGILTAKSIADLAYDTYEIKLPRALN